MNLFSISIFVLLLAGQQVNAVELSIADAGMVDTAEELVVYSSGNLNQIYNDSIYNEQINCRSGTLEIINNTNGNALVLAYANLPAIDTTNTYLTQQPNDEPKPILAFNTTHITINFNCPSPINDYNYYNKVSLFLPNTYHVSFLLNCDPNNRHKPFQYGYLILSVINAAVIIGVAMHSHVWSIQWKSQPLKLQLKWIPFAVFNVFSIILLIGLYALAVKDISNAFLALRYFGVGVSTIFVFICFNECFFLVKDFRRAAAGVLRICDVISLLCTAIIIIIAFFFQSWILYDILAVCITVGSIKLLYFNTLKQAFISMFIYVFNVTSIAIALHFMLPRSYNDYATELSSPLFFQVPDLINGLFKKCSWLVVVDVIVPGVTLSYLRVYDQNKSSRFGGVYTVWGNITFILSTALWIGLQAIYPFSIPFSLVTYLSLMLVIFFIAWRRNDWKTLIQGTFEKSPSTLKSELLLDRKQRFSSLVRDQVFDPLKKSIGRESVQTQQWRRL